MATTKHFDAWNTGRPYTESGQRIAACVATNDAGVSELLFADIDRNIDGCIKLDKPLDSVKQIRGLVMGGYDNGQYNSLCASKAVDFNDYLDVRGSLVDFAARVQKWAYAKAVN